MNNYEGLGIIEKEKIDVSSVSFKEKMDAFNKCFDSKISPESGIYGITETIKENGIIERIGKNDLGHTYKEYFTPEGQIYQKRELLGNRCNATTYFDDNGTAYLRKETKLDNNKALVKSAGLIPNTTINKGNFSAVIDAYGRPILNKISDLSIKDGPRESLSSIYRNNSYRPDDHRGHLIPDNFGGPASLENIIPQLGEVNQGKIAQVENLVRDLKTDGKTVDYEIRTNYSGKNGRPTSFEPKIFADGIEVELSDDLKKIYNESADDLTTLNKVLIDTGEKFGLAHELGVHSAIVAGGITMAVSTVENVSAYIDGEISSEEMIVDIVEDTAVASAVGYGTTFVTTAASQAMAKSSSTLISKVGNSCLPGAVVAFGVESYEDISAFARGEIDGGELAYNLGENAAGVAGSFVGGAAGGAVGSVAGPVGSFAGTVVGGTVGCAIAVEAYQTAVELCAEGAEVLADKAQELAANVIDSVSATVPDALEDVKGAFAEFTANVKLPFALG